MDRNVWWSTGPPLWSRLKYLTIGWIHVPLRMNPTDIGDPLTLPLVPPWHDMTWHFCLLVKLLKSIGSIAMKFGTDIHGVQKINFTDFGDPLTFPVATPAGQSFHLLCEISQRLPDGLAQNFVQTLMVPRGFDLTLGILWRFLLQDELESQAFHLVPVLANVPISWVKERLDMLNIWMWTFTTGKTAQV